MDSKKEVIKEGGEEATKVLVEVVLQVAKVEVMDMVVAMEVQSFHRWHQGNQFNYTPTILR